MMQVKHKNPIRLSKKFSTFSFLADLQRPKEEAQTDNEINDRAWNQDRRHVCMLICQIDVNKTFIACKKIKDHN